MKNSTLFIFIVLLSVNLNAQGLLPIRYGIKVGTNFANITSTGNEGVPNTDNSVMMGVAGGFYMEIPLSDKFYINPELIYSQKGTSFNYNYTHNYDINNRYNYSTKNVLKLAYVELNPTISYKANDKIALNIGPSVSFLIQEKYTFSEELLESSNIVMTEILEDPIYNSESLDIGLNIGLSYYLADNLLLDGKVNTGFMSIGKVSKEIYTGSNGNDPKSYIYDLKNTGILFSVAYLF